ncbi:uncharacterized protein EV154DRAFT_413690 [Mucor mucedo]|uniref:uncharacterized protein n=1 Tax=Mucor mucedo TaxID=29922 RepID=UPI00221FBFA5|nr:uncharacterized protein EV154DRAFT_413690 [Mucor mucedo]KAI7895114.1 hypothetical protein EV154DRAFT_413690 [Mucor mucedo]
MDETVALLGRTHQKPSSWYPIFTMFLVAFSGGALLAPHAQFYTEIFCSRYYKSESDFTLPANCSIPPIQKTVSKAQALIMFLTYGSSRVLVLKISTWGTLIYVSCDLLTAKYHETIGISLLFIGPLLRGLMAGEAVLMAAVQAYIADSTDPSSRTVIFARLMSSLFIGAAIGQITTPPPPKTSLWAKLNIFSALDILLNKKPLPHMKRYTLPFIALSEFLLTLVKRPPLLLYAMLKFNWTAYEGSVFYTYASLMRLFIMIGVLPLLTKVFVRPRASSALSFDIWMVRGGIGMDAICLALSGLASNVTLFVLAGMLQSVSMLAQPSIRSLLTNLVEPNKVGELLGAMAILDSIAMVIAHLGVNTIYSASVETMPNLTFYLCADIAAASCLAAFFVQESNDQQIVEDEEHINITTHKLSTV